MNPATPSQDSIVERAGEIIFLYVTFPDHATAESVARLAIEKRLAACVNILAPHTSIYRWQGKIESADEVIALFKTTSDRADELAKFVREHHSYAVPCIVKLAPTEANKEFADWIDAETSQ